MDAADEELVADLPSAEPSEGPLLTPIVLLSDRLSALLSGPLDTLRRHEIGAIIAEAKRAPETYGIGAVAQLAGAVGEDIATLYRHASVAERWTVSVCGDGWRDPSTEECDDGLGTSSARRGCSASCQVLDELAVAQAGTDGGLANAPRTLDQGRHPLAVSDSSFAVAYLEPNSSPLTLSLTTFSPKGVATGIVNPFSAQSTVVQNSNPVLAGLPCGQYAAAWAEYDQLNGDELDIAIRLVDPGTPPSGPPAQANTTASFSQFDPDIVWTGSQIVVAWVDTSNASTAPDLVVRTFDGSLNPISGEQSLAATPDSEADVALAAFEGSWAAAWRDDASGLETVQVHTGTTDWTIGPSFMPAPVPAKPALAELDATHLLAVYAVGVDSTDSGVADGSLLQYAVLDTGAPGTVTGSPLAGTLSTQSQSTPAIVNVQGQIFVSWWTDAPLGDPNGEENWLKPLPLSWSTDPDGATTLALDTSQPEVPLPRWPNARIGDQRVPAMAANTLLPGGNRRRVG